MIVIGLTGSIAMGKSTAALVLRRMGLPLHDSDAAVHRLMARGGAAVAAIGAAFPGVVTAGAVDRAQLGQRVFGDQAALDRLEAILHPLVRAEARRFLARQRRRRARAVVLDIPLLFETGGEALCDAVLLVQAPAFLQRARALARPGMTEARLASIRSRQMSEAGKRRRADFVVPTGLHRGETLRRIRKIIRVILRRKPPARVCRGCCCAGPGARRCRARSTGR